MDTETGRIYDNKDAALRAGAKPQGLIEMQVPPTEEQMHRVPPKVERNEPCPCGSGRKFKKCCLRFKGSHT
jgi:uncharacterized protein YecA (UPF0149 family)